MTVFSKLTTRPCASVRRPSSRDLEQRIKNIRMCFLDLIEQNDRVRAAADFLGQLSCFIVADISRRRADQTIHGSCEGMQGIRC